MNYSEIYWNRTVDGPGVRVSLYVSGCSHRCDGCHNEETWDFLYGRPFTKEVEDAVLAGCEHPWISGMSLLGGEPLEPRNQEAVFGLLKRFRERFGAEKTVWLWTGCVWESDMAAGGKSSRRWRTEFTDGILSMVDVLVDGPFVESRKCLGLVYRGSENQRIFKMEGGIPVADMTAAAGWSNRPT